MAVTSFGTPAMTRATSGSVTATWGTGQNRTAGHLLVAMVSAGGSTASAAALSTPSGWTQLLVESNTATTANAWVAAYYKVAAGSDSAPAFTATLSGTAAMTVTLLELAAANDLNPADTTGVYASGGSSGTLSAMTATSAYVVGGAGEYAVTCYCQEAAAATNTWNGGGSWTNAANDGSTSSVLHTAVDYQANPSAGSAATETGYWTTNTTAYGAALIVVFGAQAACREVYTSDATTTITSGGSTTPASGTAELWTAASWSGFPSASPTATPPATFHVADPNAASELIQVVNTSTGLVVRGAEGTTPVAHSSGFTVRNVISAGGLSQIRAVDWVNAVTQYGADLTGSTDSTLAIQNALLSFGTLGGWTGGGVVYLPAGGYTTSRPLIIPCGVRLIGDGWTSQINLTTGSNCDMIQWSTYNSSSQAAILGVPASSIANAFYAGVENLALHGDAFHTTIAGYNNGITITMNPANSTAPGDPEFDPLPVIQDVWIKACTGDGIKHTGRSGALFERVYSVSNNGNAFTPSYDTTMVGCLAAFCGAGFYLNHGSNIGTGCKSYNHNDLTWVSGHSYAPNDFGGLNTVAVYSGTMYFCISAVSGSTPPPSDTAHWTALSATSPQAAGYGFYWDTNAGEHDWAAVDSQENSKGDYYFHVLSGAVSVHGSSQNPNFNNGQPAYNSANPDNYASVTFDGCSGAAAIINAGGLGSGNSNGILCTELNSPGSNTLIATTDGSATTLFSGGTPLFALVDGQIHTGSQVTVNGNLDIASGQFSTTPLISSENGTTTSHGALVHILGANGTESGHHILWFDETGPLYFGLSMALTAGATYNSYPLAVLGGYYDGLGIQGSSNGTSTPIFGLLTSTQSGNGLGNTAMTVYDNNTVVTFKNTLDDGSGNMIAAGNVKLAAGTTTLAPLTFQSGTNLTTATAGVTEYDSVSTYITNETTSGRGLNLVEQKFRLTATGSTISTIANYFGSTSSISLVSGGEYEIEIDCWFLKTTASTVVWTFTNSAAPTSMNLEYKFSAAAGIVSTAAATSLFGDQYNITAAAPTVTTASLTTAVNHHHKFWIRLINGTGTSLKIQATSTSGTITPGINSSWKARRVPAANVGTFSA